jgi:hypothetical protein
MEAAAVVKKLLQIRDRLVGDTGRINGGGDPGPVALGQFSAIDLNQLFLFRRIDDKEMFL